MTNAPRPAPPRIMCASCSVHAATGTYATHPRDRRVFAADHVFLCRPCTLGYIRTLGTDSLMRLSVIGAEPLDMCNRLGWLTAVVGLWSAPVSDAVARYPRGSDADTRYQRGMLSACRVMIARLTEGH